MLTLRKNNRRQPVEVTPDEEGGATVNFEPRAVNQAQSNTHFDNLADILPEDSFRSRWNST